MWAKGQSGNSRGRPVGTRDTISALIRSEKKLPEKLIANLKRLSKSADETIAVKATTVLLEFGWGKPVQAVEFPQVEKFIIQRAPECQTKS